MADKMPLLQSLSVVEMQIDQQAAQYRLRACESCLSTRTMGLQNLASREIAVVFASATKGNIAGRALELVLHCAAPAPRTPDTRRLPLSRVGYVGQREAKRQRIL